VPIRRSAFPGRRCSPTVSDGNRSVPGPPSLLRFLPGRIFAVLPLKNASDHGLSDELRESENTMDPVAMQTPPAYTFVVNTFVPSG